MIKLAYHPASYLRQKVPADEALADIAAVGWDGFEWSSRALEEHYTGPGACREHLEDLGTSLSGMYHPGSFLTDEEIEDWTARAAEAIDFAGTVGCTVLMLDGGSTDLPVNARSIQTVADAAERVGKMASDAGMVCTWHQHWGTLFQYPEEFFALMDATDPKYLKCTLDTAHLALGGFDVPATFERYADRLRYVHLKDLDDDRRFTDLGTGTVPVAEAGAILHETAFSGWVVNDLDYTDRDPATSSRHNHAFLRRLFEGASGG